MSAEDEMGPFARTVFSSKYAHQLDDRRETWEEAALRTVTAVFSAVAGAVDSDLVVAAVRALERREWMPGGRYLYAAGRPFHQVNNCLAGDTAFLTRSGVRTLAECADQDIEVLDGNGAWVTARVNRFGIRPVRDVVLASFRGQRPKQTVRATSDHRWILSDGTETTTAGLKPGDRVPFVRALPAPEDDQFRMGVLHGIFYGDGCRVRESHYQIRLCGAKVSLLERLGSARVTYPPSYGGDPMARIECSIPLKDLPRQPTPSYVAGFLRGWMATDGCVATTGQVSIACDDAGREFLERMGPSSGFHVLGSTRLPSRTNYGERTRDTYNVRIDRRGLRKSDFLLEKHRDRFQDVDEPWTVVSVSESETMLETFCPRVYSTSSFVLRGGVLTGQCFLLIPEDSREGWADLNYKATMALMTGGGIGAWYGKLRASGSPIRKTGGTSSGPLALMEMVNEVGRHVMQGGSRRSAIWAGLPWNHPDVHQFVRMKNWSPEVRAMKERDFNFPARMDVTNISVSLDDEFFDAAQECGPAADVYYDAVRRMLKTGEPGFSVDVGSNRGEVARNAPVAAGTRVLTSDGHRRVGDIVDRPVTLWTGKAWADEVIFRRTAENVPVVRVGFTGGREIVCDPTHEFLVEQYVGTGSRRKLVGVDRVPASRLTPGAVLHVSFPTEKYDGRDDMEYTLGFLYGDGSFTESGGAEVTICDESKRTCGEVLVGYTGETARDARGYRRLYFRPDAVHAGRRKDEYPRDGETASFLAGLFDADGSYYEDSNLLRLSSRHRDFLRGAARALERLGILAHVQPAGTPSGYGGSPCYTLTVAREYVGRFQELIPTVRLKPQAYVPYRPSRVKVLSVMGAGTADVFCCDVRRPEHSFQAEGVIISNCTEITSSDDSDVCNLAHINMARVRDLEHMRKLCRIVTAFAMAGTLYSDVPYEAVRHVREKNRRLGVGLLGVHEFLMARGRPYGPDDELEKYLEVYRQETRETADILSFEWGVSRPVKVRAIAPTGTTGIVAETTTGIEPMFCAAYKRRYLDGTTWKFQFVVDPTARRMVQLGRDPAELEDAYSLAEDPERRVAFQAWVQQFVDHGISSTINLPAWGTPGNNEGRVREFADMLLDYLPQLRGITVFPDGSRGGQPLTVVPFSEAIRHEGEVHVETGDVCDVRGGASCGS